MIFGRHFYDVIEGRETRAKQISPVQFLCDRELGICGTSNHIVKQNFKIDSADRFDDFWTYTAKQRVFKRELNKIRYDMHFKKLNVISKRVYIRKIFERLRCWLRVMYIAFPAGIGRCVELTIMKNFRYSIPWQE